MDMEQFRQFYQQNFYYIIAGQIVVGILLGSIPLIRGIRNDRRNLGLIGFFVTVVLVTVSPLLAVIVAVVFNYLVRRPAPAVEKADDPVVDISADE